MPGDAAARISQRKLEHLELTLTEHVEGPVGPGWDDVRLVHDCLPEVGLDEVSLDIPFLGGHLHAPVWITGMTGGHERAALLNSRLARAAEKFGLAMGLGSQRAALVDESLNRTYRAARDAAPRAFLIANIGAPQLVRQGNSKPLGFADLERLVDSIGAQALAVHLNFLQEMMQPEGDRNARGCLAAIESVARCLPIPVMVKETGAGISREGAERLRAIGVAAIDVGGAGGTSMVRIEGLRARDGEGALSPIAATFESWGIPTAASVLETRGVGLPIVATGGVRSGLDAARALALGAHAVGVGRPFLMAAAESEEALESAIERFIHELRVAMFLTGSRSVADMRRQTPVLAGDIRAWAEQRGLLRSDRS